MTLFADLPLSRTVMQSLEKMGFEEATSIQAVAIPIALEGRDLIGQAQTGTGKTVAFSIPMVEKVDTKIDAVQGLILTPTRELCIQVAEEISKVGFHKRVRVLPIYGGQDIGRQLRSLRNRPQVIIATPGRLLDHINRKTVSLADVSLAVLDEADEMLDMGFIEDIESILRECPVERQTLLFSATMKPGVRHLAQKFMKNIEIVRASEQEVTVPSIEQVYYEVQERQKLDLLTRLLDIQNPDLAIVFGRTKRRVDELVGALQTRGYMADGLHGDLSQRQRDAVMAKFRDGALEVLVATDVAARGIDVTGVTHVFNFDMPQDVDSYVHRIGRTGRAGQTGLASTFVTPRETDHLHQVERVTKRKIEKRHMPSFADAREGKQRVAYEQIVEAVGAADDISGSFKRMAEELLDEYDALIVVSAALKLLTKETVEVPIQLTEEKPLRAKRPPGSRPSGGGYGASGGPRRDGPRRDGRSSARASSYRGNGSGGERRSGATTRRGPRFSD